MQISQIHKADRPRERLARYGASRLKDAELLAIILGSGTEGLSAIDLAKVLLKGWKDGNLQDATVHDLLEVKGVGVAKACEIVACFELGRRFLAEKKRSILLSPNDVWGRMEDIRGHMKEHVVVFFLDSRSQEILREIVSVGTLNESLIHPREVFEQAIKQSAAAIIVAHNHPSGDPEPSKDDIEMTDRLVKAGRLLDIEVIDHVIVTKTSWRSILNPVYE